VVVVAAAESSMGRVYLLVGSGRVELGYKILRLDNWVGSSVKNI